jgi:L-malate glycosyltransferase
MVRIAILTPSLTTADAVGNDVLGMFRVLEERGHTVRLFAEGWTLEQPRIFPFTRTKNYLKEPSDVLIYHYSRGWTPGLDLLRELDCRTVVKYHNVTPPEYLVDYSAEMAAMCAEGRREIASIARSDCELYLSASAYNMRELLAEGADESRSFVVPPFHGVDRLTAIEPDSNVLESYADGQTNILMVGRVSPNKGHAALVAAFAAYHHDYNRKSRLLIVGKEDVRLEKYSQLLRELIRRLEVQDAVVFTGEVSDRALKAYYHVADVFMITSDHEGFCVPLVEAMSMKIPLVAYGSSAIPETVAQAGIVWKERNINLLAESVNSIISDASLGQGLSRLGWQRYQELFTNQRIETRFLDAMRSLL